MFLKKNQGFSLVELLVVIAIIAILSAVIVPRYNTYRENSQKNSLKPSISYIYSLLKLKQIDEKRFNGFTIPSNATIPKGYCLRVYFYQQGTNSAELSNGICSPSFKSISPTSGFLIIVSKNGQAQLAMSHEGIFKTTSQAIKNPPEITKSCSSYGSNLSNCRKAGCKSLNLACS